MVRCRVCVCVSRCVGVWVCGCVGVWACGCVVVSLCVCACVLSVSFVFERSSGAFGSLLAGFHQVWPRFGSASVFLQLVLVGFVVVELVIRLCCLLPPVQMISSTASILNDRADFSA